MIPGGGKSATPLTSTHDSGIIADIHYTIFFAKEDADARRSDAVQTGKDGLRCVFCRKGVQMNEQIGAYIRTYPEGIRDLYGVLRDLILESASAARKR